ncbi:hypothetical protein [Clostridium disporicum]
MKYIEDNIEKLRSNTIPSINNIVGTRKNLFLNKKIIDLNANIIAL